MKKGFWLIWIIACLMLLWTFSCSKVNAQQTSFRVDCDDGNDGNDGTSFPGFLTLTAAEQDADFGAGDTLIVVGTCTETLAPTETGTSGNKIVYIDSTRFTDGFSLTVPDTVWPALIDGGGVRTFGIQMTSGDDFIDIIGIDFKQCNARFIDMPTGSSDNKMLQCRFRDHGDGVGPAVSFTVGTDSLISCLFLADGANNIDNAIGTVAGGYIVNNTFHGTFTSFCTDIDGNTGIVFRNNLLNNVSSTAGDNTIKVFNVNAVGDFNNNLYHGPSLTNDWRFVAANITLISVWEDSVNNHDADGATASINSDPSLQNVATTASILNTSAAFEAGTDLGFGDDIGYFQIAATAAVRRRAPIIL